MANKAKKDGLTAEQRKLKAQQAAIAARQIKELERQKAAKKIKADKASLEKFEQRCKDQQVKRQERQKRTDELHQLALKKRQIAKNYL